MCELTKVPLNASLSQEFLFMIVASYEIKQVSVLQYIYFRETSKNKQNTEVVNTVVTRTFPNKNTIANQ